MESVKILCQSFISGYYSYCFLCISTTISVRLSVEKDVEYFDTSLIVPLIVYCDTNTVCVNNSMSVWAVAPLIG
jgi:hypothetical protein